MIRRPLAMALMTILAAGCSAAPTASISSTSGPARSTLAAPPQAPSLEVMRQILPASLTPEQAKTYLIQVDPAKVFLPSDTSKASEAQPTPQQPATTPLTPPSRSAPQTGISPTETMPITSTLGTLPALGALPPMGTYGTYPWGYPYGSTLGLPAISSFYPFSYLGASWYAPYYLNSGMYYPYAFNSLWTGAYPFLASAFSNLGFGQYSYAPFGWGSFGTSALF